MGRTRYGGAGTTTPSCWANKTTYGQPTGAGRLWMGPVGLGFLVEGNYIGDARTFYCPSAGGSMPADPIRGWQYNTQFTKIKHAATGPKDLQRAGGFSHKDIAYGDWSWLPIWRQTSYGLYGHAVQSDYHYRNSPMAVGWYSILDYASQGGLTMDKPVEFWLGNTKPGVKTSVGCPPFKTQKLLGGRALVSDTFTWRNLDNRYVDGTYDAVDPYVNVGLGQYAHRDGYNVLYGDWSAKWYGDPTKSILYPTHQPFTNDSACWVSRNASYAMIYYNVARTSSRNYGCSMTEWNVFDMVNGIDVP
jgi:hypothetical protein